MRWRWWVVSKLCTFAWRQKSQTDCCIIDEFYSPSGETAPGDKCKQTSIIVDASSFVVKKRRDGRLRLLAVETTQLSTHSFFNERGLKRHPRCPEEVSRGAETFARCCGHMKLKLSGVRQTGPLAFALSSPFIALRPKPLGFEFWAINGSDMHDGHAHLHVIARNALSPLSRRWTPDVCFMVPIRLRWISPNFPLTTIVIAWAMKLKNLDLRQMREIRRSSRIFHRRRIVNYSLLFSLPWICTMSGRRHVCFEWKRDYISSYMQRGFP